MDGVINVRSASTRTEPVRNVNEILQRGSSAGAGGSNVALDVPGSVRPLKYSAGRDTDRVALVLALYSIITL